MYARFRDIALPLDLRRALRGGTLFPHSSMTGALMAQAERKYRDVERPIPLALEPSTRRAHCVPNGEFLPLLIVARGYGDAADTALEDLLTLLYPSVKRYCLARLHKSLDAGDAAADAAQETMIRVAKSIRTCSADSDRQVRNWVLTVARRVVLDVYRSAPTGLASARFGEEAFTDSVFAISMSESAGSRASFSRPMECLLRTVVDVYDDLPEATAELLWWRLILGAEWIELGERFGTSATTARRRFQRSQVSLRREVLVRVHALTYTLRAEVLALLGTFGQEVTVVADAGADDVTSRPDTSRGTLGGSVASMASMP